MIPNQWYAVLESRLIKKYPVSLLRLGEKMVAWRDGSGSVVVMADKCPHRGASLSQGKIVHDNCLQCPFHGFEFDTSGICTLIPANGERSQPPKAMRAYSYPVQEKYGYIWIWWGKIQDEYPEIPWFADLDEEKYEYASFYATWAVHYTRGIENQLDVIHLPFVHASTIGRGNRTIADGPIFRMEDGELNIWVHNRKDDGSPAIRVNDLPEPTRPPSLRFKLPNNWMNNISQDFRITISFIPVDDGHTLFCLRNYVKKMRLPGLAKFVAWLAIPSSRVILNQDERIVKNQKPIKGGLTNDEVYISQDGPIIQFHKLRQELIHKAEINK
jgi:phenylpropionate dioxygenase-like ring-hydroxylating dioxygenase large terminal subunit